MSTGLCVMGSWRMLFLAWMVFAAEFARIASLCQSTPSRGMSRRSAAKASFISDVPVEQLILDEYHAAADVFERALLELSP